MRQAIQLGLLPRLESITRPRRLAEGQIFIPRVNRLLLIGVLILVMMFKNSDALANAYGIGDGHDGRDDSARYRSWWCGNSGTNRSGASVIFVGVFLAVDLAFLAANLVKVFDGGWVPILLGASA